MSETSAAKRGAGAAATAPRVVRVATRMLLVALLSGALYLIAVRGDVLLAELGQLSTRVFCF